MIRGGRGAAFAALLSLAGCATVPPPAPQEAASKPSAKGAYYKDDGPGSNPPANIAVIPDAVPRTEPLHRYANRPYQALGKDYVPMTSPAPYQLARPLCWNGASTAA